MTTFVRFTEHNDHEGEVWHYWLQVEGNEHQLQKLRNVIQQYEAAQDSEPEYQLRLDDPPIPESEVDILVKHTKYRYGYNPSDNKVTGTLDVPDDLLADHGYGLELDRLYKGGIKKLFK